MQDTVTRILLIIEDLSCSHVEYMIMITKSVKLMLFIRETGLVHQRVFVKNRSVVLKISNINNGKCLFSKETNFSSCKKVVSKQSWP